MGKVLIVEDETQLRNAYEIILSIAGFEVATARDGKEGLAQAEKFKPDVILLDMLMPVMNGIEFLKVFYDRPAAKATDVILFSNFSNSDLEQDVHKYGIAESVLKSAVSPNELVALIQKYTR